jgi:hypothetical protein
MRRNSIFALGIGTLLTLGWFAPGCGDSGEDLKRDAAHLDGSTGAGGKLGSGGAQGTGGKLGTGGSQGTGGGPGPDAGKLDVAKPNDAPIDRGPDVGVKTDVVTLKDVADAPLLQDTNKDVSILDGADTKLLDVKQDTPPIDVKPIDTTPMDVRHDNAIDVGSIDTTNG